MPKDGTFRQWSGELPATGPLCLVYSDVSFRAGTMGYCCAVFVGNEEARYYSGVLPNVTVANEAEIRATAIAIGLCPLDASKVTAYSDQNWLRFVMGGGRISYQDKLGCSLDVLREVASRYRCVEYRIVNRRKAPYRKCHRLSRQAAVAGLCGYGK